MIISLFFGTLAGTILWWAADMKRFGESKIKIFSSHWWV